MTQQGHGDLAPGYLGWAATASAVPRNVRVRACWCLEVTSAVNETEARLHDPLALDEIEMYGELVIAASASNDALSWEEIDRVLGLK